ncbi:MAG TPA: hypothetical protein VK581_15290 [Chthoniobacterales bacterium]|nr:hypothetical protein [Chthoniobacterales bacterium]
MNVISLKLSQLRNLLVVTALFALPVAQTAAKSAGPDRTNAAADPGWPRQRTNEQGRLVYYQPQVDDWKEFKELKFRMAFALTPKGQKEVIGIIVLQAQTEVIVDDRNVLLNNFKITEVTLPSIAPEKKPAVEQLVRSFLPADHEVIITLDRLVASVEKSQAAPSTVTVQNDPPLIFVSKTPAILLHVDGEPVRADIPATNLGFVVNSNFPLFFEKEAAKEYYLYTGQQWVKGGSMEGPWAPAPKLPRDMYKVAKDPKWAEMEKPILSVSSKEKPPTVFYANKPAEVILFKGEPSYANIPGTQLSYATNTDADLFVYNTTRDFYYLAAGRWFRAANLQGPWTYSAAELPPDFADIPEDNPAARVRISVPGTDEAKDAVLLAQIPTTIEVDPVKAAALVKVSYNGDPEFKPIQGTSLSYATNTSDKIIKAGDVYYLCLQGVWFMSPNPNGPWTTAKSVPQEIYSIPPSSPVYNVTYVKQTTTTQGTVQSSYTAGYLGTFIVGATVGAILANGTGYYYPPYYGYPIAGYPIYRPYAATYGVGSYYNTYTGAYGVAHGVYGPYGGAAAARSYNPYTGTYARGATAYGPYGSRSVAQAYNPYTGTYAASRQGSNAYGSWGQSVVSNGNRSAYTQHYSNANGTVGSVQGSRGGAAVGANTKYGSGFAGKTAGGDMYAGHNGNVYKNTGSGWSSYNNGSWNSVNKPQANTQERAQTQNRSTEANRMSAQQRSQSVNRTRSSSGFGDVDRDFQNRQRGGASSERFSNFQRSGGGGRSFSGRGGGRRR